MSKVKQYIIDNIGKTVRENKQNVGTLLALPYSYTVPCIGGMFQEMYYWDTYFTNLGLLKIGKEDIARNNCDNMAYLINKYGFMPNGNRTYYLRASQPPFYSQMVREVYEFFGNKAWLENSYNALLKEYDFWQTKRKTKCGLNHYYGYAITDENYLKKAEYFCNRTGYKPENENKETLYHLGAAVVSLCENGFDCTWRFGTEVEYFCEVELNCLLYGFENNMAFFCKELNNGNENVWLQRANTRKELMNKLMWKGDFFRDYNFKENTVNNDFSTAAFYPMFFRLATKEQAESIYKNLNKLECEYGIAGTDKNKDYPYKCQWDYPNGWACQQYIVYKSLMNYGYETDAKRIAEKFVNVVDLNFETTNNLWEKYDVVNGTVSTSAEYDTPAMLGWTAGVYIYFSDVLNG